MRRRSDPGQPKRKSYGYWQTPTRLQHPLEAVVAVGRAWVWGRDGVPVRVLALERLAPVEGAVAGEGAQTKLR